MSPPKEDPKRPDGKGPYNNKCSAMTGDEKPSPGSYSCSVVSPVPGRKQYCSIMKGMEGEKQNVACTTFIAIDKFGSPACSAINSENGESEQEKPNIVCSVVNPVTGEVEPPKDHKDKFGTWKRCGHIVDDHYPDDK